jgi:hypothetical protein
MPENTGPGRGSPYQDEGQGWKGPDTERGTDGADPRLDPSADLDDSVADSDPDTATEPEWTDVNQ